MTDIDFYKLRKEAGLFQNEAARRIGITAGTLARYEHGVASPNLDTFIDIITVYGYKFILELEKGGIND